MLTLQEMAEGYDDHGFANSTFVQKCVRRGRPVVHIDNGIMEGRAPVIQTII